MLQHRSLWVMLHYSSCGYFMPDLILFTLLGFIQPQRLPLRTLRHQMTQMGSRLVDQFTLLSVKSTDGSLRVQSALKFEMHWWLNTEVINRYQTKHVGFDSNVFITSKCVS